MSDLKEEMLERLYERKFLAYIRKGYGSPCIEEMGGPFKALITSDFEAEPKIYRGLHESAKESEFTTPVFYNGCGWVDMDHGLVIKILEYFKIDMVIKKEKNNWKPKKVLAEGAA